MATQNFTLYDLLADIVPGALAIIFGLLLFDLSLPEQMSDSGLLAGAAFFVGAYFLGRLVHTFGSLLKRGFSPVYCFHKCVGSGDEFALDELLDKAGSGDEKDDIPDDISDRVLEDIDSYFTHELSDEYDVKAARRYGGARLYKETTLYSKYEALVTFFRSLFLITVVLLLASVAFGPLNFGRFDDLSQWQSITHLMLVLTALASLIAGWKFWRARNVTFINDLHILLTDDAFERQTRLPDFED